MLNFLSTKNIIILPKTERLERLEENFDWRDFTIN